MALTEYKKQDRATPSPLSAGTPGDKRSGPVEDRFRKILERRQAESGEESMDETLSETGEEMEVGNTPEPKPAEVDFTALELLQDLIGADWAEAEMEAEEEAGDGGVEQPVGGCCLGQKVEGKCPHDLSEPRRLAEIVEEIEVSTSLVT